MWRCFPWDPRARPGAPFSPQHLPAGQTVGRFDLHDRPPVRSFAGSPEHALGEMLGPFRGTAFHPAYLRQGGHPLALVDVTLAPAVLRRIVDLADPAVLAALAIRPDELAHHDRTRTQAIARRLYDARGTSGPPAGLRWWSALTGACHTTVLFTDRLRRRELRFQKPRTVRALDPELLRALSILGIRVR